MDSEGRTALVTGSSALDGLGPGPGHAADPAEAVQGIAFTDGDRASHVTGAVVTADRGRTAVRPP